MRKAEPRGFDYFLSDETIDKYRQKPPELRLRWLYMGNLLRKACGKRIVKLQDEFREGKR